MKYEIYAQEANKFINEVASELGNTDREQAQRITTTVLHAIREILTPEESMHFISQLPMMIKAVYVNGWHLEKKNRIRTMDQFIQFLMSENPRSAGFDFGDTETAKEKTKAVFNVIKQHVSVGELKDIIQQFPQPLVELWSLEEANA
jgi:uncharacterized protein (DUF2267 family)